MGRDIDMVGCSKREVWPIELWEEFTERCFRLRGQQKRFTREFPATFGMRARVLDSLLAIERNIEYAISGVEDIMIQQFGMRVGGGAAYQIQQRSKQGQEHYVGKNYKGKDKLDYETWIELGEKLKSIDTEVGSLIMRLFTAKGYAKAYANRFVKVERSVKKAKSELDDLVCRQHPNWPDATHVFFG